MMKTMMRMLDPMKVNKKFSFVSNENCEFVLEDDDEDEEYEEVNRRNRLTVNAYKSIPQDDNKTGLKALYNGTFEDGDDDEESYEGNEDEVDDEESGKLTVLSYFLSESCFSDEDDDLSEEDVPAGPIEGKTSF